MAGNASLVDLLTVVTMAEGSDELDNLETALRNKGWDVDRVGVSMVADNGFVFLQVIGQAVAVKFRGWKREMPSSNTG